MKLTYAVTVSAAAIMLCRVVWTRQPLSAARRRPPRRRRRELRICLRRALHDARAALFHRLRPDADGGAAGAALADAGLAMGRGPVRRLDRPVLDLALTLGFSLAGPATLAALFALAGAAWPENAARRWPRCRLGRLRGNPNFFDAVFDFLRNRPRFQLKD